MIARILIALERCQLQTNHLNQMIFVNKNWLVDPRVGCFQPSNFVSARKAKFALSQKFYAKFENEVEWEEFQDLCDFLA